MNEQTEFGTVEQCTTCGPQVPPTIHAICHPNPPLSYSGCGHRLADHADSLRCRICKRECGTDCRPLAERLEGMAAEWERVGAVLEQDRAGRL